MTDRMSGYQRSEARCFHENSPRPPVPGEEAGCYIDRIPAQSPALTPRRSLLRRAIGNCDASAPMGFEPEGSCDNNMDNSPPACLRWATNLYSLLHDLEGAKLFEKYAEQEGATHFNLLRFYYACEGLDQQTDKDRVHQLIKLIKRRFLQRSQLPIPEHICKEAKRRIKEGTADKNVFDAVQQEVERLIRETIYPNFLSSDLYLSYVAAYQNADSAGCPSSNSSRDMSVSCGPTLLPTLHEDIELNTGTFSRSACGTPGELRLTKDVLMYTQQTRAMDVRPKSEAYAGLYLNPEHTSPYHVRPSVPLPYSSYNPVTRQSSELQSLSSDARTDPDSISLTDVSMDGMSIGRASRNPKEQYDPEWEAIKKMATMNRDEMPKCPVIPRTSFISRAKCVPKDPQELGHTLIHKLEQVLHQQEKKDKSMALADTLREKLQFEEDDQSILDQHVSRVWSDPTPSRSPRLESPRSGHSPERSKRAGSMQNCARSYKPRKEKDLFSTFSVDSGNIHDFTESGDLATIGSYSSLGPHMPKSKSIPSEYADSLHKADSYYQGHDARFRRSDMSRRSATKKSMTELTDSGVSVVSDVPPVQKEHRTWMAPSPCDKKADAKHSRHGKKYGSRSGSLERPNRESFGIPSQPFITVPGMPLLPPPNTATQLEEAKRRLLEEDRARGGPCSMAAGPSKGATSRRYPVAVPSSNQSTLRRKQDTGDFTTAIFSFCDENVPYRIKIPGQNVTLKQFKEYLPKKGSYRYFFTTECEDLDTKIIQEEITDDCEVLPLWEGKIKAQVKALE